MVEVKLGRRGINENLQEIYSQMQPPYEWERLLGGKGDDCFLSIQEAKNGYILAGYTYSDVKGNDGWLVKIDGDGRVMWEKKYGDYADDYVYWAEQTKDGGYIAAGKTYSYAYNSFMGWLLKVNENGEIQYFTMNPLVLVTMMTGFTSSMEVEKRNGRRHSVEIVEISSPTSLKQMMDTS